MSRTTQLGMFALIGFAMAWRGVGVASAQVWDVPQKYQEMDYWCWAACMESILTYYAHPHTQTEIAQYGTGGVNTWTYSYGSGTEGGIFRRGCDQILDYFANIQTITNSTPLSLSTVEVEMAEGRPILVIWSWDYGGGHAVVLRGLSEGMVYLMDPWSGPTLNTFSWTQQGGAHTWEHSVRLTTFPSWDAGYSALGGGWRRASGFGDYVSMGEDGWIWHNQHGFFFVPADDTPSNMWIYAQDMGWLWTSRTGYPFFYRQSDGAWLWYNGSTNPRWFRNMTENTWEWVNP